VVLFRGTVTRYQWRGITIAMTGVITVITRGDPAILTQMDFNRGDLWLVGASIGIACYQTLIGRVTKDLHPVVLLQVTMMLGTALMMPAYLVETLADRPAGGGDCICAWRHRVLCGVPIDLRGLPDQCGHRGVGTGADGNLQLPTANVRRRHRHSGAG